MLAADRVALAGALLVAEVGGLAYPVRDGFPVMWRAVAKDGADLPRSLRRMDLADRVTVLRDGQTIETLETKDLTQADIIRRMVGREIKDLFPRFKTMQGHSVPRRAGWCGWSGLAPSL